VKRGIGRCVLFERRRVRVGGKLGGLVGVTWQVKSKSKSRRKSEGGVTNERLAPRSPLLILVCLLFDLLLAYFLLLLLSTTITTTTIRYAIHHTTHHPPQIHLQRRACTNRSVHTSLILRHPTRPSTQRRQRPNRRRASIQSSLVFLFLFIRRRRRERDDLHPHQASTHFLYKIKKHET